jgi:hypothetical protein
MARSKDDKVSRCIGLAAKMMGIAIAARNSQNANATLLENCADESNRP